MTNSLMPLLEAMHNGRRYQGDGEARQIIRTLVAEVERLQRAIDDAHKAAHEGDEDTSLKILAAAAGIPLREV